MAPIGRPREFDLDEALDCALQVFWRKGYEGTSLPDLTAAMGINRPSLYAAFGNKESLFRKALDRYLERSTACLGQALAESSARAVVERLLHAAADLQAGEGNPPGCLVVQAALACGQTGEVIRQELIARRAAAQAALGERLEQARSSGDLPAEVDPSDLARYISTVINGMAVQAASGASRAELQSVIVLTLRSWPAGS
jgi:AcrR family transcriptional regulator